MFSNIKKVNGIDKRYFLLIYQFIFLKRKFTLKMIKELHYSISTVKYINMPRRDNDVKFLFYVLGNTKLS